jgi:hypothetical protein
VTIPTTPYVGQHGTLDVSTGLTYPAKAERARRNPRVCLLFADPLGEAMGSAPVAVVQGHAAVRDSDLQANTDRYTRESQIKLPAATKGQPKFALKRMAFYYARIWIEITPLRILWWSDRSMEEAPDEWRAPEGTAKPASDPAPPGNPPPAWREPPSDWRSLARRALSDLPLADLTFVDAEGVPMCIPVQTTGLSDDRVALKVGAGAPGLQAGPACLTLHGHPEQFTGQENHTLIGELETADGELQAADGELRTAAGQLRTADGPPHFKVQRALADWSLVGNRASAALSFLSARRSLSPRLRAEAARRGQPVPDVHFA